MVKATDFDKKMLLMSTRLAHEADLKMLLLSVLEELLNCVQFDDGVQTEIESVTLIRCTIRLVVRLMADPGTTNRYVCVVLWCTCFWEIFTHHLRESLVDSLISHFRTGKLPCLMTVSGSS
jgi:hypothetical protein